MGDSAAQAITEMIEGALEFLGERLVRDHPLGPLCTYRVGGSADLFVNVSDGAELEEIARALSSTPGVDANQADSVHVIGRGSNLLVADAGVRGLVLQLGESFSDITAGEKDPSGSVKVLIGAAASMPVAARRSAVLGLAGFEWAVGIPGSLGGAVRMNAGGHGSDMAQVLERVHIVDLASGKAVWMDAGHLRLGYRSSAVRPHQVVTLAEVRLTAGDSDESTRRLSEIVRWRRENQPGGPNAGSVFTNPPGDSAGRLIDTAGCRGTRLGSAAVSDKHANFIQADPGGRADDVLALMKNVVERVRSVHAVTLHAETVLLGFPHDDVDAVKGATGTRKGG